MLLARKLFTLHHPKEEEEVKDISAPRCVYAMRGDADDDGTNQALSVCLFPSENEKSDENQTCDSDFSFPDERGRERERWSEKEIIVKYPAVQITRARQKVQLYTMCIVDAGKIELSSGTNI